MHAAGCSAKKAEKRATYERRRPEKGTLYRIVAEHAETVFAEAEDRSEGGGYPKYVKDEVRAFIDCGLLQHGFARCADLEKAGWEKRFAALVEKRVLNAGRSAK